MNRNGTMTTFDAGRTTLPNHTTLPSHDTAYEMIVSGRERIQDLVRQSTLDVQNVLAEVRETITRVEAELEVTEKISVVVEKDRTVLSVERNFRFAKDK